MANKIPVTFKGAKVGTLNITIEELPNLNDFLDMDGSLFKVTKKTFIYDDDGKVLQIDFDLELK
ncbi:hypothetical protein SB759_19005 [Pseudomonas sp. SIMBA_059]